MLQNRIICKLKTPLMSILQPPWCTVTGEFAVVDLNLGLGVNILSKLFGISNGVIIDPEHFEIEILKFLDDLINLILSQLI